MSPLPFPADAQVPNISDPQAWRIVILQPYTNHPSVQLITQEWWFKKKKWGQEKLRTYSPKPAPKGDVSISIGLSITVFLKSLGENLYHCHAVFPASLIWPGCIWRSGDPDQMRLMGKLDFFPWSPWKKTIKQQGDLGRSLSALLSPLNTTLLM